MAELFRRPMSRHRRPTLEPCLPRPAKEPPAGPGWIHEIKHDGFRILARRDKERVRLFTRHGTDFTARYPKIAAAVESLSVRSCALDGEAIAVNQDGLSVFNLLRYRQNDNAVVLCAFDLIELDGEDLRWQPLERRKTVLADLLRSTSDGIAFNTYFDGDGATMPALSAARALSRSGSARPIAPAGSTIGSRSRTQRPRPQGGRPRRIGAIGAARGEEADTGGTRLDYIPRRG
jgi:bifunctional non-homologous end joining protein LigD